MATFPGSTTIKYGDPIRTRIKFKTLVSNFDDEGEENRKAKWTYPHREITLKYDALSKADAETLWEFYIARKGRYEAFAFFESTGSGSGSYHSYTGEYVGKGDSTTTSFNLPAIDSSGTHTVILAGTSISSTAYTFNSKSGTNGEDQLDFSTGTAPGSTEIITYDFTGRLKVYARFKEDYYDFDTFYDSLVKQGIELQGLLNGP